MGRHSRITLKTVRKKKSIYTPIKLRYGKVQRKKITCRKRTAKRTTRKQRR